MAFSPNAQTVYADGPAGSPQQPAKSEIRKLLKQYENVIEAFLSNGGLIYTSKASLDADLAHGAKSSAWVINDPVVANNGVYQKQGASGAGSWTRVADLPYSFIISSDVGAGTANAIQATTSIPVSSSALVWTNIFEANTASPVTISFNGGAALTVKTNSGNNIAAGGLVAGMIVLGIVSGSTFRLVSDQASAAIVAAAEAAQIAAEQARDEAEAAAASAAAILANSVRVDQVQGFNPIQQEQGRNNLGLAQIAESGSFADLVDGIGDEQLPTRIQETWAETLNWNTTLKSGWYYADGSATGSPDVSTYIGQVIGGGGDYAHQRLRAFGSTKEWFREVSAGVPGDWQPLKPNNITQYGAVGDGTTAAQSAIALCIQAQTARITTVPAYDSMPQAPTCEVVIPSGLWHLTANVDTKGKFVTYMVDEAADFTSGSAAFLCGKIVRPTRVNNPFPVGFLDGATGFSVKVGDGSGDNSPLVTGFTNPNQISSNDTSDLVGGYFDTSSVALLHSSAATYSATGCVLTTPADVKRLKRGMLLQTRHSPTVYRGQITDWSSDGTTIEVANGWYAMGSTTATTPSSSGTPIVDFNVFHKVWAGNFNAFLLAAGYGYQAAAIEAAVWNDKVTPSIANDSAGRTWVYDGVNLGPRKGSIAFIARGAFFEGYRATGTDVGFHATAYADLGYATPGVGFQYTGDAASLASFDSSGRNTLYLTPSTIEFGVQGVSNVPAFHFHSGATVTDFDSALYASGGDGVTGNGTLNLHALVSTARHFRPVADNAYQLGGGAARWTEVFAVNGSIITSDERLKRFYDAYRAKEAQEQMAALKRAIAKIEVRTFQWLDAIEEKGDQARFHVGVSAQEVERSFASEGLDARNFGIFCEDKEYEQVEVKVYHEVPELEEFEEEYDETVDEGDRVVVKRSTRLGKRPKVRRVPLVKSDGTPVMRDVAMAGPDGHPIRMGKRLLVRKEPAYANIPVMRKKETITLEDRETGRTRLALRYDQLAMLMIAASRA